MASAVESPGASPPRLQLLGPLSVTRAGIQLALPPSRKVRALLAYLALASHDIARSTLCELLWDLPNDPRGELRWCLSKLRGVLDGPDRTRVLARSETIRLDLAGCEVDALEVGRALQSGVSTLSIEGLRALAAQLARGDLLEGLELARSAAFSAWLIAQRRRMRAGQAAILEHLVRALPPTSDEAVASLEQWLRLAPFDRSAHELLLGALAAGGRLREGDEHLAATARLFEREGQDWAPIGHAWRAAKLRHARPAEPSAHAPGEALARAAGPNSGAPASTSPRRASLAVMPFTDLAQGVALRGGLGDGLAHDIITRLAKLRSMFVIAQGTMFALQEKQIAAEDAGRRLDVDYVASGALRRQGGRVGVSVQLAETRSARILWAEEFDGPLDDTFQVLDRIGDRIVSSIASQIEQAERNRAVLKAPNSLDAWEAHHRGLWHMVRFNREDNDQARHFFETAVRLDPTFARPYAGLSFTHFQDAFQGWSERATAEEQAYRIAAQGLMADERDPAAHWAMGRALWLRGRFDDAVTELDSCVDLSPNFALGHYMLAFVHAQSGDAQLAIRESDQSRELSPFDPLLFAMMGARAMGLMRLQRHAEAADWALKAAARPNAHVHILAIAMHCLALAGRVAQAYEFATAIQRLQPGYGIDDFLRAFRFDADGQALIRQGAKHIGFA